jgi:hypothetical protein
MDEELHNTYSSPNIWMIKWKRNRLRGHVARIEEEGNSCKYSVSKMIGRIRRRWAVIKIHIWAVP